jgi:hypothetical protein
LARRASAAAPALVILALACAEKPPGKLAPPQAERGPSKVVYAGVRSSRYGIKPFPEPAAWVKAMRRMADDFPGATPCGIWIVSTMSKTSRFTRLEFPAEGRTVPFVEFEETDRHERYLDAFDGAGIQVFLQVEPANAEVPALIDLVLERYGRHPCVVGFGVDVEWNKTADHPETGMPVDDVTARAWEERVKAHNPAYRLFLKHWDEKWMPPSYRGEIIFVDDSQIFPDEESMIREFSERWAPTFSPNTVVFQVGYNSDRPWWSKLPDPPKTLGEAIRQRIRQEMGIIWVDFSLRDVLLPDGDKQP